MPSLTRKIIKGRSYYYARWCQRVGGRPKIVKTAYLGPIENIVQAVETAQQPLPPQTAEVSHFADVAALYDPIPPAKPSWLPGFATAFFRG